MRRKKLDVVFDDSANKFADLICEMVRRDIDRVGSDHKVNKSEIMRVAMYLGLKTLNDKLLDKKSNGLPMSTSIKMDSIRSSLGTYK